MSSEIKVHEINANNFKGQIYECKSFYIFNLASTSTINDVIRITHNLNIKFPPGINYVGIQTSSSTGPAHYALLKSNEIFIQAPNNPMLPSLYIYDIIPKFVR